MAAQPRMCPILSISGLQKESRVVGLGSSGQGEAIACQQENCMWFEPIADEQGKVVGAKCAPSLIPLAISQLTAHLQDFKKA